MAAPLNKNAHLSLSDRQIIETGITNGSTKTAIAKNLGKDKSTIGKEIKSHRKLTHKFNLPLECSNYQKCKLGRSCRPECSDYIPFSCKRRDRSPGACNGCFKYTRCRFDKYRYSAIDAHNEYKEDLVNSRIGVNATVNQINELGNKIKPLLQQGQSIYAIKINHPEITVCEKTLYNYVENGVFQDAGVSISAIDLKNQVRRKLPKAKKNEYKPRKDKSYLIGRKHSDFEAFISDDPNASVVEMDTVYNDVTNGPFIQTFKFMKYDLLFCILHDRKDTESMRNGIFLLEQILGVDIFNREVKVLVTDRGSEFTFSDETEFRADGSRRTRIFYCDPMASGQKGSVENIHILLRNICPKDCDLMDLGLDSQMKADLISSHINSYPKEKLNGKTSFQFLKFLSPDTARKFFDYGLSEIPADEVTLKPYLLKNK